MDTRPPIELLPGILATIDAIAGRQAALAVAAAKGGVNVYIPTPARLKSDHWLVQAVGLDAARKIAAAEGGLRYDIPCGPLARRDAVSRTIERALSEGKSTHEVARLAGVHVRTVRRHKSRIRAAVAEQERRAPSLATST